MENVIRHAMFFKHQEVSERLSKVEIEDEETKKAKMLAKGEADRRTEESKKKEKGNEK